MEQLLSKLNGKKVYDCNGNLICALKTAIIDPINGKILGLICKEKNVFLNSRIILPTDIKNWDAQLTLFPSYELHSAWDLIRVSKVLEDKIKIKGNKVLTASGEFVGYVRDIIIDPKLCMLSALIVKKKRFKFLPSETKIIHQKNIIEITKKAIIVKDSHLKIPLFERSTGKLSGLVA